MADKHDVENIIFDIILFEVQCFTSRGEYHSNDAAYPAIRSTTPNHTGIYNHVIYYA